MMDQSASEWAKLATRLNQRQQEAVTAPAGPLLVIAGPGSGKTHIITYRAAYLISRRGVPPDRILAVTFTNRAAEEMRLRLERLVNARGEDIWFHTFHAVSLRLLREYGDALGLPADFVVADEDLQCVALREVLRTLDLSPELHPVYRLRDYISRKKSAMQDPALLPTHDEVESVWSDIAHAYHDWLREHRALDFDDLIYHAVRLLMRRSDIRRQVQARFPHVLVDEYQDINLAQYHLLTLLAPRGADITVVADGDQSIYGWRGAEPALIGRFQRAYRPRMVILEESYRSTQTILDAAQWFITRGLAPPWRAPKQVFYLRTVRPRGDPIYHYLFPTAEHEQSWLATLIRRLHDERGHRYGDIAILYRTHRLADPLEGYLVQHGVPVHRVQKDSFFQRPWVREVVRYLYLIRSLASVPDADIVAALNFPQTLADELTIMQLERLAHRHQINLADLARHSERFPELSPLTRANLRAFLRLFEEELRPVADQPIGVVVERLLNVLALRRSPFGPEEWQLLRGWAEFIARPEVVTQLRTWLDRGISFVIQAPATIDGACAAIILSRTLREYLGHTARVMLDLPADARHFQLVAAEEAPLVIHVPPQRVVNHALAAVAWRLAQDVLATYEHLADGRFVVYDLETTGTDPVRDEIIEVGAQAVERRQDAGPLFFSLVRPARGTIPSAATAVHGITWADVKDAASIEAVLPRFLAYVGEATVVGHNITAFDNRFIDRDAARCLGRPFCNPTLDTLLLAQRLMPGEPSYSLEHLLHRLNLGEAVEHRAAQDVQQTRALLFALLTENQIQLALNALPEMLPLVGLGMLSAGVELQDENQALWHGALRTRNRALLLDEAVVAQLPESERQALDAFISQLATTTPPPLKADEMWAALQEDFMAQIENFARFSRDVSLDAFLDYQALVTSLDVERPSADNDQVTMMTLHNAKGSEFPVVIIIGVEEGNLPLWTTFDEQNALQEERRVFYVGMTRAQERLYLCSVRDRGDGFVRTPSRFAFELPTENVRRIRVSPRGQVEELKLPARGKQN